jgi:hypothetical protein
MSLVRLADVGLPINSSDRDIWRFAQANQMLLLTDNRNLDDADSLEQTILDENSEIALPVITISRADRVIEPEFRERCAIRLLEIVLDLQDYMGGGRLYIP